ncbi:hypothetical protein ACMTAU_09630, partial [Alcaligenes pakistanensis]
DMFNRIAHELSHHGAPTPYSNPQNIVEHTPDVALNYLHILHNSVLLNELDEPALLVVCQYLESTGQ